ARTPARHGLSQRQWHLQQLVTLVEVDLQPHAKARLSSHKVEGPPQARRAEPSLRPQPCPQWTALLDLPAVQLEPLAYVLAPAVRVERPRVGVVVSKVQG